MAVLNEALILVFLNLDLAYTEKVPDSRVSSNCSSLTTSTTVQCARLAVEITSHRFSDELLC